MKKILVQIILLFVLVSCKNEKSNEEEKKSNQTKEVEQTVEIDTEKVPEIELPANTVKVNYDEILFKEVGLTVNSIQCLDKGNNDYLLKILIKDDSFKKYETGAYSFFIQLYPFEEDIDLLPLDKRNLKHLPLSISLKNVKKVGEYYVLFKAFASEISIFDEMIFGIYDTSIKQDVFRGKIQGIILKN